MSQKIKANLQENKLEEQFAQLDVPDFNFSEYMEIENVLSSAHQVLCL